MPDPEDYAEEHEIERRIEEDEIDRQIEEEMIKKARERAFLEGENNYSDPDN